MITSALLAALGCRPADIDRHLPDLRTLAPEHGIDTALRAAHFLAQLCHESALLHVVEENLNYGGQALLKLWPNRFSPREAETYQRQPERIANRAYADRLGNGPEESGDGWRYRGRGLIQLSGRDNYQALSAVLGVDLVADPDRVATDFCCHSAFHFWSARRLNTLADPDDLLAITRVVNGGLNGLEGRATLLARAKRALGI